MLRGFRFVHPVEVRFRDLDAIGHVNNATYLTYLESARLAWWLRVTGREGGGVPALDLILARVELDYRSPVQWGEHLEVGVRCASMRRSSFALELVAVESASGRLVAEARNVCAYFDYATGRSRPLTEELRARLRSADPDLREEV